MNSQRGQLLAYLTQHLSEGRLVFTREEAQQELCLSRRAFLDAAERLQAKGHLITPRRGFYVIVPPQYLTFGAPPPALFIDSLMRHEAHPYYVGVLKAAEVHGATHQAVMQFQVITDKRMPLIRAGRSAITFYYRQDMSVAVTGVEDKMTEAGFFRVSGIELTMLDLLRYPRAAAGLDNVATVLRDLAPRADPDRLGKQALAFERAVVQRLGHLLDHQGQHALTVPLREALGDGTHPWIELEPKAASTNHQQVAQRDENWGVIVRRIPEADE